MKKFYQMSYCNRMNWIFEHIQNSHLSLKEQMVLLMIEYMNEQRLPISLGELSKRLGSPLEEVDGILATLSQKGFLHIHTTMKKVTFSIDGFFERCEEEIEDVLPLFKVFETEFSRPLTAKETMTLSQWQKDYESEMILHALRQAVIYRKLSFPYIQTILDNWKKEKVTVEQLNEAK